VTCHNLANRTLPTFQYNTHLQATGCHIPLYQRLKIYHYETITSKEDTLRNNGCTIGQPFISMR